MANVLVLYYSAYGHIERMAQAIAEGARSAAGTEVTVKRVPELVPEDLARKASMKLDQKAPIASVDELPSYDAIIFGTPTRFGNMTAQMRNFLDQRPMGQRRAGRQGRECVCFDRHTTRRPGNDHHELPQYATASGDDHRGVAVLFCGSDTHGSGHGWHALRGDDARRARRLSTAYRERAGRSSLPGQTRRRDRRQTRAWCRRAWTDTRGDAESNGDSGRHGRSAVKEAN